MNKSLHFYSPSHQRRKRSPLITCLIINLPKTYINHANPTWTQYFNIYYLLRRLYSFYQLINHCIYTVLNVVSFSFSSRIYKSNDSNDCRYHAVPGYGVRSCWILEDSIGEYVYYPAGFLLCVNTVLFTATCVKLCMYGRGTTARARKNNDAFGEWYDAVDLIRLKKKHYNFDEVVKTGKRK